MADGNLLFIGVQGSALALDRATGEIVWNTHLSGSDFVYVTVADGALYASARGKIFLPRPAYRADPVEQSSEGIRMGDRVDCDGRRRPVDPRARETAEG